MPNHNHDHNCLSTETPNKRYLEVNLLRFIHLLRHTGLRISSGEALDAVEAMTLIDVSKKESVKAALKATLVKKSAEAPLFDRTFELFFAPPRVKQGNQEIWDEKKNMHQKKMEEASADMEFLGEKLDISDKEMTVYANLPEKEKARLKDYMDKTAGGKKVEEQFKPLLESVVKGSISYWRKQLKEEIDFTPPPDTGDEEMNSILNQVDGAGSGRGGGSLLKEDMQNIADKDLPKAQFMIKRMAQQLVNSISRRYRLSKKHSKLDLRRTIRDNLRYGGTPFSLRYKSRRIQKPRLLLLCDVSGSMARYASFVLQFIYSINSVVSHIESFVFADNLEPITPYFDQKQDFDSTMLDIVNKSSQWGGGTSIAVALEGLRRNYDHVITGNTIVLIVSDTKTTNVDKAARELSALKRRAKNVIWLNTLPESEADNSHTVKAFRKEVKMYPCNTLADLERIIRSKVL